MRDFGLNYDVIDEPLQTFKMKITVDTISKVRELYGVKIKTINVTADENGKATLKIIDMRGVKMKATYVQKAKISIIKIRQRIK